MKNPEAVARRVHSRVTFWIKTIVPSFYVAACLLLTVRALWDGWQDGVSSGFALVPLAVLSAGMIVFYRFVFTLADEVWDVGSALRIRRGSVTEIIALGDIVEVKESFTTKPKTVTIVLKAPSRLGSRVKLVPPYEGFRVKSRWAKDIRTRIRAARHGPASG